MQNDYKVKDALKITSPKPQFEMKVKMQMSNSRTI
jgi:hypothetical protein